MYAHIAFFNNFIKKNPVLTGNNTKSMQMKTKDENI